MTLSSATQTRFTVGQIVTMAYQQLGVLDAGAVVSTPDMSNGLLWLRAALAELPAGALQVRAITLHDLTLVANQLTPYSLPDAALDVLGDAAYISASQDPAAADSEQVVTQIPIERWQALTTKSSTGTPTMFWVDRETFPLQVSFYPWPSEAGTVRFQAHRPLDMPTLSTDELDLEQHWVTFAATYLALLLAPTKGLPMDERSMLSARAAILKQEAEAKSGGFLGTQLYVRRR